MSMMQKWRAALHGAGRYGMALVLGWQAATSWADAPTVVAVDVGHTIEAPGATSARGVPEYVFNKGFAEHLVTALERHPDFKPLLVNADGLIPSLDARVAAARAGGADVFVSIHHDAVQPQYLGQWNFAGETLAYSDTFRGYSVFYSGTMVDPRPSALLTRDIGASLRAAGFMPTAAVGVVTGDVLDGTFIPDRWKGFAAPRAL